MNPETQFLLNLSIGVLLGLMGQVARAAIGLKKESDRVSEGLPLAQVFDGRQFLVSLLFGGVAGGLAAIMMGTEEMRTILEDKTVAFALVGAGYSGADFLEGLITKATGAAKKLSDDTSTKSPGIESL